jgi:hypothetical protein
MIAARKKNVGAISAGNESPLMIAVRRSIDGAG